MASTKSIYEFAGSDEGIRRINEDSATMCDLEDAFFTSIALRDWASALQMAHGFIQVWTRPLHPQEDYS
jgi:hypothetical protein